MPIPLMYLPVSLLFLAEKKLRILLTDSSFQRGQHRRARTQTSAVQVQHPLDQRAAACIWPFKQPSQLGPSICINAGTFVMGTITF